MNLKIVRKWVSNKLWMAKYVKIFQIFTGILSLYNLSCYRLLTHIIAFDILNCQIFILTLNWIKDLYLKFVCFRLLSKNPHFWISFSFEIQTVIAFGISNCQIFILTLNWNKDLHLKFSCFCLLSLNPRF